DLGRRRKLQRERSGCDIAERVHQVPVRVDRLLRSHLLEDDRRDKRFEDRMGPGHADATDLAVESGDKRVDGDKARVVIVLAAQRGSLLDGPIRAWTPRLHIDETEVMLDVDRGGARGSSRGAPYGITLDRKSTRLNSSHVAISYAVFCLKKKNKKEKKKLT